MTSPLPPDPYSALGVAQDATSTQIKSVYRKLVLKCHPDKIQDPSLKQAASDQFHKIQTAYEIISDDDRRRRYDAEVKLAELRRAAMEERRGSARDEPRSRGYTAPDVSRDHATRDRVYEERRPSDAYAAEYTYDIPPRGATRKDDYHERPSAKRTTSSRPEKTKTASKSAKETERARGKDRSRRTDKEIKRDRDRKYAPSVHSGSDSEPEQQYERSSHRYQEEAIRLARAREEAEYRKQEEERRRKVEELRREQEAREAYYSSVRHESGRSPRDFDDPGARANKYFEADAGARDYMSRARSRQQPENRASSPAHISPTRSTKGAGSRVVRDRHGRPVEVRRPTKASTKNAEPTRSKDPRTKVQTIVDDEVPRRPPGLSQSYSSPESIRIPHEEKPRSSSMDFSREQGDFRPAPMRRAETMPSATSPPVNMPKRGTVPTRGSNLRTTTINHGQPTPDPSPEYETSPNRFPYGTQYADDTEYPTVNGYQTEERVPGGSGARVNRRFTRSPSPIRERHRTTSSRYPSERPKMTPLQTSHRTMSSTAYYRSQPDGGVEPVSRPTLNRAETARGSAKPDGGYGGLYREIPRTSPHLRQEERSPVSPVDDRYRRDLRESGGIRVASGYMPTSSGSRRPSMAAYGRSQSYRSTAMA